MPHFRLIALSNPVEGTDAEFTRWYREQHLKDVAAIDGVTSASFHRHVAANDRWQYLAIYDVEADDPMVVLGEIKRRSGTDLMPMTPALDTETVFFGAFESLD